MQDKIMIFMILISMNEFSCSASDNPADEAKKSIQEMIQEAKEVQKGCGYDLLKKYKVYLTSPKLVRGLKDVSTFAYHPKDNVVAIGSYRDNNIHIFDLEANKQIMQLEGHQKYVGALAFNADGTQLASGSNDGVIYLWDAMTWKRSDQLKRLKDDDKDSRHPILQLYYNPKNDTQLISKESCYNMAMWNTKKGEQVSKTNGYCCAYNTEGTQCAIGHKATIKLYDAMTCEIRRVIDFKGREVSSVAFHPINGQLAVGFSHNYIALQKGDGFEYIEFPVGGIWPQITYNAKGNRLLVGCQKNIYIYDTVTESRLWVHDDDMDITHLVAYRPGGKQFAILFKDAHHVWRSTHMSYSTLEILNIPRYRDVVNPLNLAQAVYVARELETLFAEKRRICEERDKESQEMYDSLPDTIKRVLPH